MGITFANLKLPGKIPEKKEELKIPIRGSETRCLIVLSIAIGILKGPVAFLEDKLPMTFSISFDVSGVKIKLSFTLGGIKSKGDLSVGGIDDARLLPIFVKNSLKAFAIDEQLVSSILSVVSILEGILEFPFLNPIISLIPFHVFLMSERLNEK